VDNLALSSAYVARDGAPVITTVDPRIFTQRYYGHCLACTFCHDACCQHGVDVSLPERDRILTAADDLEPFVGRPRSTWFTGSITTDADFAGGGATRTAVLDGGCVFLQGKTRGCALHAWSLAHGTDYHQLKPMVSALFPVTFGGGTLCCSEELLDGSLVCLGDGPTAYAMARAELGHYFGMALVAELDRMATTVETVR
jgi:Fe-S-cluster containining protein